MGQPEQGIPADLLARLCGRFGHVELRRDGYAGGGKRPVALWFLWVKADDANQPLVKSGPDPAELAHEVLGDRERLKICASKDVCEGAPLPPGKFSRHAGTWDGLSRDCRDCEAKRLRTYRRRKASEPCRVRLEQGRLFID